MPVTLDELSERQGEPGRRRSETDGRGGDAVAKGEKVGPMLSSDRLYHLIALCYEATSADDGWSRFAMKLAQAISATHCAVVTLGGMDATQTVLWSHGQPPHPAGNWLPDGFEKIPSPLPEKGAVAETTPAGRFLIGSLCKSNGRSCIVVAARPANATEFGANDTALLEELLPHIDRALKVCRALRSSEYRHGALTEILDRLPEAIFLVDSLGNVVASNLAARAIARTNDGIALVDGRVSVAQPNEQETLRRLIAEAARQTATSTRRAPPHADGAMTMSVSRKSGKTALPIVVTPVLCRGVPDGRPEIVAAIITKDAEQRGSVLVPNLTIAFGLTPGETRLAGLVAGGLGLKEASEALGVTKNTVRTHMKRVYAKTGVHSQADLVRLLSRGSIELRKLETDG